RVHGCNQPTTGRHSRDWLDCRDAGGEGWRDRGRSSHEGHALRRSPGTRWRRGGDLPAVRQDVSRESDVARDFLSAVMEHRKRHRWDLPADAFFIGAGERVLLTTGAGLAG